MTPQPSVAGAPPALPGDDEVLCALLRRRRTGVRADGNRIALVVSGGGMRGAYAGGMAHALEEPEQLADHSRHA